jgi:hypothetical protein
MASRNPKELTQLIQSKETRKELKTLCFLQLQKKSVPYSCYEWLTQSQLEKKNLPLQYLNEKCLEFSGFLNKPNEIKKILQSQSLSPFCRKIINQQKKRIEYKLRDSSISDIFTWYFKEEL